MPLITIGCILQIFIFMTTFHKGNWYKNRKININFMMRLRWHPYMLKYYQVSDINSSSCHILIHPLCCFLCFLSPVSHQTSGQTELENWITAIHSACATALARQHHRDDTVRLLRTEIRKLEQKIDMDEKMKKMGDMQLSTVTDAKKRKTILEQVCRELL